RDQHSGHCYIRFREGPIGSCATAFSAHPELSRRASRRIGPGLHEETPRNRAGETVTCPRKQAAYRPGRRSTPFAAGRMGLVRPAVPTVERRLSASQEVYSCSAQKAKCSIRSHGGPRIDQNTKER